jgi:beta-lactam-binding protein with PASTA domain
VLAVVALIVGLILSNRDPGGAQQVTVPDIVGQSPEQAVTLLQQAGLVAQPGEPFVGNCEQDEGRVESQPPAADASVDEGTTVTYEVCGGPATFTIPDNIVGSNVDDAQEQLEGLGLRVTTEPRDSERPEGEVLEVTPEEGSPVEAEDRVTLVYSAGNLATVPDVVGRPEGEARGALEQAGFQVQVEPFDEAPSDPDQIGTVAAQDPSGDEPAERDSTVTIFIYQAGPELSAELADQTGAAVTISWDNGINGDVTIDWGDGLSDDGDAQGDLSHEYEPPLPGQPPAPFTITVTDIDDPDRSVQIEVEIPAP